MHLETYTDATVFERLADEWNSLLDPDRPQTLFLRVEWQRLWWESLGRGQLNVVSVRDDTGRLAGIAPWFVEEANGERTLQTLGCLDVSDYLDVLYAPGSAGAVLDALAEYLDSRDAPDLTRVYLCSFPHDSPTLEHLPRQLQARGWRVETPVQDLTPVVSLPDTYEAYLEALDGKQRRELRRKIRRAEAWPGGVDWYTVGPEHDLAGETDAFLDLMALSSPEKAAFLEDAGNRAFFEKLAPLAAALGWLRLQFLRIEGQRAAAIFNLVSGSRMMVYNSGIDPDTFGALSPGWVLFGYSIADAIEQGFECYDFLRGGEDYKYRLGGRDEPVFDIVAHRG